VGGIVLHEDGGVIVTGRDVLHQRNGESRVALDAVTGFNDLSTSSDGSVYVGALRFHPFTGESPVPGEIWRIAPDAEAAPATGGVLWANGIGFSPDGATAYGSDYARICVLAWDVADYGSLISPRTFAEMPAGSAGNLVRFSADGSLDRTLDVPATFVSSLCFGGDDMCDVYVTTGDGTLLRGRSEVEGLPLTPARV